ncbi:MAG: SURF1 family protein [Pseudomonadota bacterium]
MRAGDFEIRLLPTLLVGSLFLGLLWLGTWQWNKADAKRQLIERFDAAGEPSPWIDVSEAPERYSRVSLAGRFWSDRQILMDGMTRNGVPGVNVLTPFETDRGDVVVVNRGWRTFEGTRSAPLVPDAPDGPRTIVGRVRAFAAPGMRLGEGNASVKPTWPRLAIYPGAKEIGNWLGRPVASHLVLLDADVSGGFVREWRPDGFPPERHIGYAVQWYSLALALLVLYIAACRHVGRKQERQ